MMKTYIRIFVATLLLLGACKTQKPIVQDGVTHAPVETTQPNADTINYNYQSPRYYSVRDKVFKEFENYETAFDELKAMFEGRIEPNFERAVFISESPYLNNKYSFGSFQHAIDWHQFIIETLIGIYDKSDSIDFNVKVNQYGRFNIDDIRHLPDEKKSLYKKAVANWAIFKYITDTTAVYPFFHMPFTYASHDPFGKKDWTNSQVINLLVSGEQKGNCFALTAVYKILADRLNADARLCTAPQHIYIQHRDKKGDYFNVELATAGHPGDGTIQTLTHTTTEAIKSGIALRSYDVKQSIGLCLVNLAKSYEHKFGSKDDDFMLKCAELVLKHDRLNLNALLLKQQVLDARVTDYAKENNINDISQLKSNSEISQTVYELEKHLALLYRLGYRQMPYDMQEIIMTGIIPENFEDKNPSPFTTIVPKEEHKRKFTTLYGGLFQEVFEIREFEPYGHFTFQTTTNKITVIDTTAQTGFLIDPVAFAYDFGARMYDARLGIFTSVDPMAHKYPGWSPYSAFANNPIRFVDTDGRVIVDPASKKPVEFVNGEWKTVTNNSDGTKTYGNVSERFNTQTKPMLDILQKSEVGRSNIAYMQSIPTLITIDPSLPDRDPNANSLVIPTSDKLVKQNGEKYYESVNIVPDLDKIKTNADAFGLNLEEKISGVLAVEVGHLRPGQIKIDQNKRSTFAQQYTGLLNDHIRAQISYRNDNGISLDETLFTPTDKFNEYGFKLDSDLQEIRDGLKK